MHTRTRFPNLLSLITAISLLSTVLGSAPIASAIINGQPDGNGHPYVGLLVFDVGGQPAGHCRGSLVAPTVVLTAGHCIDPGTTGARIWFDSVITDPNFPFGGGSSIEATAFVTNPGFCVACAPGLPGLVTHDQAIVILSTPVTDKGFAVLPSQGLVDALPMMTAITVVGYGPQVETKPPAWKILGSPTRFFALSQLVQGEDSLSAEFVKLTANPAQGKGGPCLGDSGGPQLLGNIVIAVTSFVADLNCTGVDYGARIDTSDALGFINSFLKYSLLSGGNLTPLSSPPPAIVSARNINNLQQIVGSYSNASPILQATQQVRGFSRLEAAFRDRDFQLYSLQTEPVFDKLRPDPHYKDLLRRDEAGVTVVAPSTPRDS